MIGLPWLWDAVRVNLRQKTYCTPPKNCHITPLYLPIRATSPLWPLPSVSEVAVVAGGSSVIQNRINRIKRQAGAQSTYRMWNRYCIQK